MERALIAVGSRGLGVVQRLRVGSVSTEILRASREPVLVVTPGPSDRRVARQHPWAHPLTSPVPGGSVLLDAALDPQMRRTFFLDGPSVLGWERHEMDARHAVGKIEEGKVLKTSTPACYSPKYQARNRANASPNEVTFSSPFGLGAETKRTGTPQHD